MPRAQPRWRCRRRGGGRQKDHPALDLFGREALQHLETVEARHRDVQHHEIGSRPPNGLERGRPVRARCEQGVAGVRLDQALHAAQHDRVIVGEHDAAGQAMLRHTGSLISTREPAGDVSEPQRSLELGDARAQRRQSDAEGFSSSFS